MSVIRSDLPLHLLPPQREGWRPAHSLAPRLLSTGSETFESQSRNGSCQGPEDRVTAYLTPPSPAPGAEQPSFFCFEKLRPEMLSLGLADHQDPS